MYAHLWYNLLLFARPSGLASKYYVSYKRCLFSLSLLIIFLSWLNSPSMPRPPNCRSFETTRSLSTLGRTPLCKWSARIIDLYLTTRDTHNRQTALPPVGFEPTIPVSERPQTTLPPESTPIRVILLILWSCVGHPYIRLYVVMIWNASVLYYFLPPCKPKVLKSLSALLDILQLLLH